jgi:hypothetical protein
MKKKINRMLTFLLTGIMLLGSVAMASAAPDKTSTDGNTAPVVSAPVVPGHPGTAPDNNFQNPKPDRPYPNRIIRVYPVKVSGISYYELSYILSEMVYDRTITSKQKRAILSDFSPNCRISRYALNSRLYELVYMGKLSWKKMNLILSYVPAPYYVQREVHHFDQPMPWPQIQK